jgi:hypothetical protein
MTDALPTLIDSPAAARTAVRVWAARTDRMSRTGELAIMIGRCHTEAHLRFFVDALAEYLGLKPDSPEPSFPRVDNSKETRMVEPIPVDSETRDIPLPGIERRFEAPSLEAKFEEMATPMNMKNPFIKPVPPDIRIRETPFTKIVKTSPLHAPEGSFAEIADEEPAKPPVPEVKPPEIKELPPAPLPDPPRKMTDTAILRFEAPNRINQDAAAAAQAALPVPAAIPSLEPVLALDKTTLPQGVDPEILADVMRVEQCRRVFESTHQQIEVWEVFTLVMLEGDQTRAALVKLLALNAKGEHGAFMEGALDLFQQLLSLRAKFGKFVRDVRKYVATLPVGRFGKETMETALGFLVVSARGREAATRWVNDPKRSESEASNRWESLISTTMRYQTVLQDLKK